MTKIERNVALVACALLFVAFAAARYLPMVDLPQHAGQISVWLHMGDPAFPASRDFALNLRTPYLTAYLAAWLAAKWLGAVPALKVVVWLSIVAHFGAFALLVRQLGYPSWLSLLGLPLAMGYPFYFGFVSFIAALPLVLLALSAALRCRENPTWKRSALLAALLCATLLTHGFALGLAVMMTLPLLVRGNGSLVRRLAPFAAPLALAVFWLAPGSSVQRIGATVWQLRLLELVQVPALLVGASGADHAAELVGAVVLLLIVFALGRQSREPERWAPLALLVLGYCTFPLSLGGFGPLHPRFAAFMVPALLIAFEPRRQARTLPLAECALALSSIWFCWFALRLVAFQDETRPIADFVERMPRGLRVRPIVFERNSSAFPALPALLHLSAYYQAEKGGIQGYSFAMYPTSVVRYVATLTPGMQGGAEWHPEDFSVDRELPAYDCFLVHSSSDRAAELFGERSGNLTLAFHEGAWWAYRVATPEGIAS
ncbi:MAG TPA: hypothetical protein VH142_25380 [Polyangiaceae bacterium]|nr:hypothetical protein [Polyangiaceae bacterium]